ncbi:hypothetical protein PG991_009040 [Apiospora marii]|uniref:DUF6606 domain-containing protein n=1 Tax=Apiospora marii TaxID=335849 RepID=A0ABR1RKK0_9PEZI
MVLHHEVLPADLSESTLLFFFHHVFLPPKLPNGDDSSSTHDDLLVGFVQACRTAFAQTVPESTRNVVFEARTTLRVLGHLRDDHGHLHEDALRKAICGISEAVKDGAVFEMFELSPDNAAVMGTRGRLVRSFPAFAVQVDSTVLTNPKNQSKLPWRRNPLWLLVRVTLQLSFQRADPSGGKTYKKFMLYLLSKILEAAEAQSLDSDILYTMSAKIARRLTKLGDSESGAWVEPIRKAMYRASMALDD